MDVFERDAAFIEGTYARFPVAIERGKGSLLYGFDGKEYIDLAAGIAVNIFGAADSEWINAVENQLSLVAHTSNLYYTLPQTLLAEKLCERTGLKKVFFANSGAEANECAIKTARKYSFDKYGADRNRIVTLSHGFHGRTVTTLAATGQDEYHRFFDPFTGGFDYAEPDCIESTLEKLSGDCCAVLLELIQGEGGVNKLNADYVRAVAAHCEANDILLIVDEVQTGNGRSGKLYCYENYGISPDIVTTAKGLGGGLPIGAAMFSEKVAGTLTPGTHGSTFGGNPVCAAGALNIIDRIDDALLTSVKEKGEYALTRLRKMRGVENADGIGLMLGAKTAVPPKEVVSACLEKGVLLLTAKTKIRLLPALNIPGELLEKALDVIEEVLAQ